MALTPDPPVSVAESETVTAERNHAAHDPVLQRMVLTGAVVSRGGGLTVTVLDAGASAFPAASIEKYRTVVVAPSSKGPAPACST